MTKTLSLLLAGLLLSAGILAGCSSKDDGPSTALKAPPPPNTSNSPGVADPKTATTTP